MTSNLSDSILLLGCKLSLPPLSIIFIFCGFLILTNILCQWQYHFYSFTVVYGLFIYPLTFLVSDYVSEIYGKKVCLRLVFIGLLFATIPSLYLATVQITIGSMLAYIISQFHDVWAFHWWKKKTNGKFLWLRNNASTWVSQGIDTVLFSFIAFYGILETETIISIIYTEYPIKVIYALLDTGPLYLFIKLAQYKILKPSVE